MNYKRILTIQDISCVGQCSLTVALPILSACGLETAILPSAVLSTHTAGFSGYTFRDLSDDMPGITEHWAKEKILFSAVYTGYLGSAQQIAYVQDIFARLLTPDGKKIVDPAMADNGKLYPGFDQHFVEEMKKLSFGADIIIPNITEAALLTDMPCKTVYDENYITEMVSRLHKSGVKTVVLTSVGYKEGMTGVLVSDGKKHQYYSHPKIENGCHGTGDVYSSAFVGAYMNGKNAYESAVTAADYTVETIKNTVGDRDHWYGVKFEPVLPSLIKMIR